MPTLNLNESFLPAPTTATSAFSRPRPDLFSTMSSTPQASYASPLPVMQGATGIDPFANMQSSARSAAPVDPSRFAPPPPIQSPGNNLTNQGYTEQSFEHLQNRLMNDPYADQTQGQFLQTQTPTQGESYLNSNLGTLDGPGQGDQYWSQVQGQYQNPMAGEQFAREATQNMSPSGPASAFYDQAMGQYDQFTGYSGPQNTQGQYSTSQQSLAGGTQGEQGLGQIAGQYDQKGTYSGPNNAAGQYQQNAGAGPMASQSFYDQVSGSYQDQGRYTDQNRAGSQYEQTQGAFGDMPIANFDPFYDRARQLGVQSYNQGAAGRGVYGSSEALSGVGNVITDIEAQRANRSFDAEMARSQEQRMRQQLLGEQARQGDLSSLAAFGANMTGLETFGNLANQASTQTLGQQTMLGNQARDADVSATDAFRANLEGVDTFANANNLQGRLELDRNELLGNMANQADTQALGAQEANIRGLDTLSGAANNADRNETERYSATTNAMNQADRTGLDRLNSGADVAFRSDDSAREDYRASTDAADRAADNTLDRTRLGADIASTGSRNDLARLDSTMSAANTAEDDRQGRQNSLLDNSASMSRDMANTIAGAQDAFNRGDQQAWEDSFDSELAPALQQAGYDQQQIDAFRKDMGLGIEAVKLLGSGGASAAPGAGAAPAPKPKPKLDPNPY